MQPSTSDIPNSYYRVSVKALVFDTEQRLLVSKNREGLWEIPGGGLDHNETLEQCVIRELAEELQATVLSVGNIAFCYRGTTFRGNPKMCIAVRAHIQDGPLVPGDDDLVEMRFVTREELLDLPFQKGEEGIKQYVDEVWS